MTREEVCNLQEKQQEPEEIQLEILGRQKNPETQEQKDSVQIQLSPGGSRYYSWHQRPVIKTCLA